MVLPVTSLALEFSTGKSRHGMLHVALDVVQTLSDLRTSTLICRVVNENYITENDIQPFTMLFSVILFAIYCAEN